MLSPCGLCQFEQVVGGAEHRPFASDLFESSQQELAEASDILDLAEHRFGKLLSQPIAAAPPGAPELKRHRRHARASGPAPRSSGMWLRVLGATRRQIRIDPAPGEMGEVCFVTEAGIG